MLSDAEQQLLKIYKPSDELVILDIGSCEGEDAVRYARRFPRARIFAFEPLPDNLPLIERNLRTYCIRNVEVVPVALSDRAGQADFHVSSGTPPVAFAGENWNYGNKSSSLLAPAQVEQTYRWLQFNQTITVPTNTLRRFCAERRIKRVDFIHMDVQGGERLVLDGAAESILNVGAVWLEVSEAELYKGQPLRNEIRRLMTANGFLCCHADYRGVEGDEFYVNLTFPRMWMYAAAQYLRTMTRTLRYRAGAIKRRMLGARVR